MTLQKIIQAVSQKAPKDADSLLDAIQREVWPFLQQVRRRINDIVDELQEPSGIGDYSFFIPGLLLSGEIIAAFAITRTVDFPLGLTGSKGFVTTPPTVDASIDIMVNGGSVGSIVIGAGDNFAQFLSSAAFTVVPGDDLYFVNQAVADITMSNLRVGLKGTRTS